MDKLKETVTHAIEAKEIGSGNPEEMVEVYADSLDEALQLAAEALETEILNLDYKILERGGKGLFGFGKTPYHVLVSILPEDSRFSDIADLNVKLSGGQAGEIPGAEATLAEQAKAEEQAKNKDGRVIVRVWKTGIHLKVDPPRGQGKAATRKDLDRKLSQNAVQNFDEPVALDALKAGSGEYVKIGEWSPKPENDSVAHLEIAEDEMKAFVTVIAPRPGGRHLQTEDVVNILKRNGVVFGFQEEEIHYALENDVFGSAIVAAKGVRPEDGKDAEINYKVNVEKDEMELEEKGGQVDYKELNLIENVVGGQILAEKRPATKGKPGKTITNRVVPAKDGRDTQLKQGKGTILSDDGSKLIAEINGQVVFAGDKISVEPVYKVAGDVSTETGNIVFLGSVVVTGSVQDNFSITAAGNIEVYGSVQKAHLQAEGDIIIRQGIMGKDGAKLESTNGSLVAKFIQQAEISVEGDVRVAEGILHSHVSAGGKVTCNGRRAQIVGGVIQAGEEIRAKSLGSTASPPTEITVGTNPKILHQLSQLKKVCESSEEKLSKVEKNIHTLDSQRQQMGDSFPEDKNEMLVKMMAAKDKLITRIDEAKSECESLEEYLQQLQQNGKIHVEKTLFPGVTVNIKNATFPVRQEFTYCTLAEDKGEIKFLPFEKPDTSKADWRQRRSMSNKAAT